MKTMHCDECKHYNANHNDDETPCDKDQRPRFYMPRHFFDRNFGWKKKCALFEKKEQP